MLVLTLTRRCLHVLHPRLGKVIARKRVKEEVYTRMLNEKSVHVESKEATGRTEGKAAAIVWTLPLHCASQYASQQVDKLGDLKYLKAY